MAIPKPAPEKTIDLARIGSLFGTAIPQSTAMHQDSVFDVKVNGILMSDDPGHSIVILDIDGQQQALSVGDKLSDGEVVRSVDATDVSLSGVHGERTVAWDMRAAPTDMSIAKLPIDAAANAIASAEYPHGRIVKPTQYSPVATRLAELRAAAMQTMEMKLKSKKAAVPAVPSTPVGGGRDKP